jgi:peptidoglycan-associated lipoprotein
MKFAKTQLFALTAVLAAMTLTSACSKKTAKVTPPPPPGPAAPTVSLEASPSVIQQGQSTMLTWHASNAQDVTIAGLGTLPAEGSRQVTPNVSTTYTAVAKGPGGTQEASARVTVNPATAQASSDDSDLFGKNVRDVFFDYDKYSIRADQSPVAQKDASFLAQHPDVKVLIEGHCDDRGSDEYNLALGASRAEEVKQALQKYGVAGERIKTVSLGKEKPFCSEDNENCWRENRRDHLAVQQ